MNSDAESNVENVSIRLDAQKNLAMEATFFSTRALMYSDIESVSCKEAIERNY